METKPVSELPLMKKSCKTCPFKVMPDGSLFDAQTADIVIKKTLFSSQQICHSTEGKRRKPKNRCVGSWNYNYQIYKRMGFGHLIK
jgi:hypothetical protein